MRKLLAIFVVVALVGCAAPADDEQAKDVASEASTDKPSDADQIQINKRDIFSLAAYSKDREKLLGNMQMQIAQMQFIFKQFAEDEELGPKLQDIDAKWQEHVSTINQQNVMIQQQNAKLQEQEAKINQLMESMEKLTGELAKKDETVAKPATSATE